MKNSCKYLPGGSLMLADSSRVSLAQLVTRKPRHWRLYWRHLFSPGADDSWLGALGLPDCGANRGRGPRPPHGPPRMLGPTEATRAESAIRVSPRATTRPVSDSSRHHCEPRGGCAGAARGSEHVARRAGSGGPVHGPGRPGPGGPGRGE